MTFSEPVLIATIISVPAMITGIGTFVVGIRNGHKADDLTKKAQEIHILVNSNLAEVKADLALANDRVQKLEIMLASFMNKRKEDIRKLG